MESNVAKPSASGGPQYQRSGEERGEVLIGYNYQLTGRSMGRRSKVVHLNVLIRERTKLFRGTGITSLRFIIVGDKVTGCWRTSTLRHSSTKFVPKEFRSLEHMRD